MNNNLLIFFTMKDYNPWHIVSSGKDVPKIVNSIIEIPKGSKGNMNLIKKAGF